ncbi:MAG: serine/threonine protein kinase [Planctomycetes bacterium]|nr:serine/threonine protein kinase [Planctomycetota bacterium]
MSDEGGGFEWSFGGAPPPPDEAAPPAPAPAPPGPAVGAAFAGFEVTGVLGRGGMGAVYRARDPATGRDVALKVLRGRLDEARRERFRREGELTAALAHPGIVRVHSAGEHEGAAYLAYELVEGGPSCEDALRTLPRPARVALLRDVARAVGHAHAQGIVHRDLKPANVLIDAAGRPLVADFGLAQARGLERLTATGATVGTPLFMAPEQLGLSGAQVGPPTDVWALGVMLYLALCERLPFEASTLLELGARVCAGRPAPPRRLDATIPPSLEAVCLKALATRPEDRYPDAAALARDLDDALAGRPVTASRSGVVERLGRLARARRAPALALALALAGLGGWLALAGLDVGRRAPDDALRERLLEARRGACADDDLEAALGAARDLGCAQAHLLLAQGAAPTDGEGWARRAEHAAAAARLDPVRAAPAFGARARALEALGRLDEAVAAQRACWETGREPAALVALARLLGTTGDAAASLAAADEALEAAPLDVEAWALRTDALAALGRAGAAAAALDDLARRARLPWVEPLRAGGGRGRRGPAPDPRGGRRRVARRRGRGHRPRRPPARGGAAHVALARVRARGRARAAALVALEQALTDLVERRAPRDAPDAVRRAGARWLLGEAAREVAFVARPPLPDALPPDARRERVRALVGAALDLPLEPGQRARAHALLARAEGPATPAGRAAALAAHAAAPTDVDARGLARARAAEGDGEAALALLVDLPRSGEVERARGEALLALGRAGEALAALTAACAAAPGDDDAVLALARARDLARDPAGAEAARDLAARLRGARRAEADALTLRARHELKRAPLPERQALLAQALELDPLHARARFYRGHFELTRERALVGFRGFIEGLAADPAILAEEVTELLADLGTFGRGVAGGASNLQHLLRDLGDEATGRPGDDLLRGLICAAMVEYEELTEVLERGVRELTTALARDPGEALAYVLRGFLHLRAGRLVEAERDLEVAREAAPRCGNVHLYEGLLLAARDAPDEEVLERLARARQARYPPAKFEAARYRELAAFIRREGFRREVGRIFRVE